MDVEELFASSCIPHAYTRLPVVVLWKPKSGASLHVSLRQPEWLHQHRVRRQVAIAEAVPQRNRLTPSFRAR